MSNLRPKEAVWELFSFLSSCFFICFAFLFHSHSLDGDLLTQIFVAFVDGFTVYTSNPELLDYHHRVIANLLHGISICLMYKAEEYSDKYLPYIIDTLDFVCHL
jgi:hypothetical protein